MELTKNQIQEIDERLKRGGIKYWDLRIEMIDHIVSDLELNAKSSVFKVALEKSLRRIGWNTNLRGVNSVGWRNTNKRYRALYLKEFIGYFIKIKNLVTLGILMGTLFLVSKNVTFKTFYTLNMVLLMLPAIPFFYITFDKQMFKRNKKYINLDYGVCYFSLSFLMIGFPISFLKEFSETNQIIALLIILPLHYIATYSGYKVYKVAVLKIEKIKKAMC